MFVQKLDKVSSQVEYEIERIWNRPSNNVPFENKLHHAIKTWSDELNIDQDITLYILQEYYQLDELTKLTTYIWQEGITEKNWKYLLSLVEYPQFLQEIINFINI